MGLIVFGPRHDHVAVAAELEIAGFDRIQRSESVSIALDRISADIGASEYMRAKPPDQERAFSAAPNCRSSLPETSLGPKRKAGT